MKKFVIALILFSSLLFMNGCAIDKYATYLNFKNVERMAAENEEFIDGTDLPDSVKTARKQRNKEAVDLAKELAIESGNKIEDLETEPDPIPTN